MGIIKPYLKPGDNFLDIMCGYSPLAGPLLDSGYSLTGFDDKPAVVKDLKRNYPKGNWIQSSFEKLTFTNFSVFLFLGLNDYESLEKFLLKSLPSLIKRNNPRLFFLEAYKSDAKTPSLENPFVDKATTSHASNLNTYNVVLQELLDCGYKVLAAGEYDAKIKYTSARLYVVLGKAIGNRANNCS